MKHIGFFLGLFPILLLVSCSSDNSTNTTPIPVDTSSFTYPFTNGCSWSYTYDASVSNIQPDSIRQYFSEYPIHANGIVTILYDTSINGIKLKCFYDFLSQDTNYLVQRIYYSNSDSVLTEYGYRSESHNLFNSGGFLPDRKSRHIRFKVGGIYFNSLSEIGNILNSPRISADDYSPDTLMLEYPPVICMKYPVITGTEWFRPYNPPGDTLYKKYLDYENIAVGNKIVSCVKMQFRWSALNNLFYYNYYSKYGQLKRTIAIIGIIVTNEFGQEMGSLDMNDDYQVYSYNIVNP